MISRALLTAVLALGVVFTAQARDSSPWGGASVEDIDYRPQKVVYDVAVNGVGAFENVLDRASYLSKLYNANPFEASIVLVLHGDEINYFAIENHAQHSELMRRAQSLTVGGVIEIRMCTLAAEAHGYAPEDIHGFVKMVPMADAEIIRLQQEKGYVYMQ